MIHVLLADDDPMVVDLYKLKFDHAGFSVAVAENGSEVSSEIAKQLPNIILLDRRLGDADGLELFKQLRANENTKALPIIVLSNMEPKNEELLLLKSMPPSDYLIKEKIELNDLVEKIISMAK